MMHSQAVCLKAVCSTSGLLTCTVASSCVRTGSGRSTCLQNHRLQHPCVSCVHPDHLRPVWSPERPCLWPTADLSGKGSSIAKQALPLFAQTATVPAKQDQAATCSICLAAAGCPASALCRTVCMAAILSASFFWKAGVLASDCLQVHLSAATAAASFAPRASSSKAIFRQSAVSSHLC